MFKRLNLRKHNCERLFIWSHATLPSAMAEEVFSASQYQHVDEKEQRAVFFGTRYTINRQPYVVQAEVIQRAEDDFHIGVSYHSRGLNPPPEEMERVEVLAKILAGFEKEVEFSCTANFVYKEREGWKSLIPIPTKLTRDFSPFTHTEAITFSRRENDSVVKSLGIRMLNRVTIVHTSFVKLAMKFEASVPNEALDQTEKLSNLYVTRQQDEEGIADG